MDRLSYMFAQIYAHEYMVAQNRECIKTQSMVICVLNMLNQIAESCYIYV